jgi:rhodanese-related sulfurtransferase
MNGSPLVKAKWTVAIVFFSTTFAAFPNPVGQQGWRLPKMYPKPGELFMLDLEIAPRALEARLKSKQAETILLDVREPWEFATAQISGSKSMPMGEIPSRAFQELDPEAHIVTVCHSGVRSLNVAVWLRNQGFEKVQSLSGGIDGWSLEVDPAVPRY